MTITNTQLAADLSALVNRWNTRENQMIALISQSDGTVIVTDGLGNDHALSSFPQLQQDVQALMAQLSGSVANADALIAAVSAEADRADTAADAAQSAASTASTSSTAAAGSASAASAAAAAAAAAATTASEQADMAGGAKEIAAAAADIAVTERSAAQAAATSAGQHATRAGEWANKAPNTVVANGQYSARHWAVQAQSAAAGAMTYKGTWSAASGQYPAAPAAGHLYTVSAAGTVNGTAYAIGDQIVYSGSAWQRIENVQSVTSVAGRTGAVELAAGDVKTGTLAAARIPALPISKVSGLQTALNGKAAGAHLHATADIPGLQAALDSKAAAQHSHAIANVTGLQAALNAKLHGITTANEDISQRLPSGFYQRNGTGTGWPVQETAWWHLISLTHANTSNYYALQLACKYSGHGLMFRNTANNGNAPWHTLWHSGNFDPDSRLKTTGGTLTGPLMVHGSYIQIKAKYETTVSAELHFQDETDTIRSKLFWHRPSDSVRLRRYNATTGAVENELWLRNTGGLTYTGGPITAPGFNGNATSASKLSGAPTINGTAFNGSANIVTSRWGAERTLTIGGKGKPVNGSANVAWSLAEIGAAAASHTHAWGDITGKPAQATRWPKWGEVTDKPASFPPATHSHAYLPLTGGTLSGDLFIEKGGLESKVHLMRTPGSGGRNVHLTSVNDNTIGIFDSTNNKWLFHIDSSDTVHFPGQVNASGFAGTVRNDGNLAAIQRLTQAAYDALPGKDPNTLYIIT